MPVFLAEERGRLGGFPGRFAGDTGDTVVPAGAGAQDHPAAVQYARPQVARGAGGVAQLTPPLVQPEERFLDDILSRLTVAEHDVCKAERLSACASYSAVTSRAVSASHLAISQDCATWRALTNPAAARTSPLP